MRLPPSSRGHREDLQDLAALVRQIGPIAMRPIETLQNYAHNPRKHPQKQIVMLKGSICEFGIPMPVLIDSYGVIVAGEAVTEAARQLGLPEVPVIVADGWSPARVKAFRLAANRLAELAQWDQELLALEIASVIELDETPIEILGWDTGEIDCILEVAQAAPAAQASDPADEQFATPACPISRPGDLWLLGEHRLLCGSVLDETSWEQLMAGREAAMVFSDAPYNVRVNGHVRGSGKVRHAEFAMASGEMSPEEFTRFLTEAFAQMAAATRDGGLLYLCMDWRHLREILGAIDACGLSLINMCVWNKTNGGQGSLYRSKHELVLVAKKGQAPHTNNVQLGRYGRYRANVWDYPGVNSFGTARTEDLADHPTVKPVALVAEAIRDVTKPRDIVVDGFMGSGTTILAAIRAKRIAFGTEIEPAYVDVAIRRFTKLTGEQPVLAETGESFSEVTAIRTSEVSSNS